MGIERLCVCGSMFASRAIDGLEPHSGQTMLFPRLQELVFVDMTAKHWASKSSSKSSDAPCLGERLVGMLRERNRMGVPIKIVKIPGLTEVEGESWWEGAQGSAAI